MPDVPPVTPLTLLGMGERERGHFVVGPEIGDALQAMPQELLREHWTMIIEHRPGENGWPRAFSAYRGAIGLIVLSSDDDAWGSHLDALAEIGQSATIVIVDREPEATDRVVESLSALLAEVEYPPVRDLRGQSRLDPSP